MAFVLSLAQVFHEIPGKRWDALTHLFRSKTTLGLSTAVKASYAETHGARLDFLGVSKQPVVMAEVGVEAGV